MKKTLLTLALVAASAAAFGQGKVLFANNGSSLVTLTNDVNQVASGDQGVAGLPVATSGPSLPSGARLSVGLYVGSSSGSLALVTTTPTSSSTVSPLALNPASGGSGVAGQWSPSGYQVNGFPSGTVFLQVRVWDATFATYEAALAAHPLKDVYLGQDNVFTMTLGTSVTYPNMTSAGGSTWAAVGNNSPILVSFQNVPEPGTMALAGLGAAAMMIFRRRNK